MTLEGKVTDIGKLAFYNCNDLTSLSFTSQVPPSTVGNKAFDGCDNLKIYVPEGSDLAYGNMLQEAGLSMPIVVVPPTVPQTGDNSRLVLWFALMCMAGAAMLTLKKRAHN